MTLTELVKILDDKIKSNKANKKKKINNKKNQII